MRRQRGLIGLMGLAALVGVGFYANPTQALVTTEQSASILVFPKVVADGTRDTVIQITNTSNNMRHAHCFYVDGAAEDPGAPVGPLNPPRCMETDFDIWLTKQQPTHWVVSAGRWDDPTDPTCRTQSCNPATSGQNNGQAACCDAGFDPGRVPPMGPAFTGELKCIEVDASGFPVPGNSLKGEATLVDTGDAFDIAKYNAIGLKGFDSNNMDATLCLGGAPTPACPSGAEYEACPQTWLVDHAAVGGREPSIDALNCPGSTSGCSSVGAQLTVIPCSQNFETQNPNPNAVTLQYSITNEFEQTFSASTTVTCWASWNLEDINDIFRTENLGGNLVQTRMRSASGTPRGVIAIIEEARTFSVGGRSALTAQNAHNSFADQAGQDLVVIPNDQIQMP